MTKGEKTFWGAFAAIVVVALIGAVAWRIAHPVTATSGNFNATTVSSITSTDWTTGQKSAKVSLIEYGDFQCPACGAYEPLLQQLRAEYGNRVAFVFRNFPLYQVHPNAGIAAQAVEAAGVQGKYWEMHDLLYAKQKEWADAPTGDVVAKYFNGYARSLGLDVSKFGADINSAAVKNKIQNDVDSGNAAHVDHTPTFFINLTQIPNPNSVPNFRALLNAALASSTAK